MDENGTKPGLCKSSAGQSGRLCLPAVSQLEFGAIWGTSLLHNEGLVPGGAVAGTRNADHRRSRKRDGAFRNEPAPRHTFPARQAGYEEVMKG